jgi:hypothetical protein
VIGGWALIGDTGATLLLISIAEISGIYLFER